MDVIQKSKTTALWIICSMFVLRLTINVLYKTSVSVIRRVDGYFIEIFEVLYIRFFR